MSDAGVRGRFLWHELSTTDTKAAGAFYLKAVGWTTQTWDENPTYVMFAAGGRPMAGLLALGDAAGRPNWLTYIGTADVEATSRQAQALGAKVLKSVEGVPSVGKWIVLQDPQGAVFAILQPSQAPQPEGETALGDFSWHELATTDGSAAFKFYQQLFGWEETGAMDMGPELGTYYMYGKGGRPMGGIYKAPAHMKMPPNWLPYVLVTDSQKAADATKKAGGQVISGPMEVPGGDWIAIGIDPQGCSFAVHSRKPEVPAVVTGTAIKAAGAKKSATKAAKKTAAKAAKKSSKKTAKKATKKAAKKAAKKAVKKAARKSAKKSTKKAARKSGRKAPARKAIKRPGRKVARKTAKTRGGRKRSRR
jgi:predicted enzyme related to lactoylglutathione lyase